MENTKRKQKIAEIIFVTILTIICFVWSIKMPYKYGSDEEMKMDICQYIYENNKLPNGGDEAVRDENWGISYSFTPILDYMISAGFMKVTAIFTTDFQALLVAARLPSVLSYMGLLIMVIKISKKLFNKKILQWLFRILIACLPQLIFLGSYINNDCFAVFCISLIIYSWLKGIETKWNIQSCISLGIGIGLCALSYYNAYGYILTSVILFVASFIINQKEHFLKKQFWKKGFIIFVIAFALSGWWFIRSAYLYNGDFLGLKTTDEYGEKYALDKYKPSHRITPKKQGQTLIQMLFGDQWIWQTVRSFVAVFGNMTVMFPIQYYIFYIILYIIALIGSFLYTRKNKKSEIYKIDKNKRILEIIFKINVIIPLILSMYYSYFSDFQAQGRYIMPIVIPFMYFITKGINYITKNMIKNEKIRNKILLMLIIALVLIGCSTVIKKVICMYIYN